MAKVNYSNELTGQILNFLFEKEAFAWRNNTLGVFDRRRGLFRTAPKKGVSDIICCFKGRFIAIEVKSPKDKLSPEQEGFIASVRHCGGLAVVVRSFEEFLAFWNSDCV